MEISDAELARIQEKIDKLKNSKFKQQMLPAWRPLLSFGSTMIIFGVFGIIFLTLGIVLYIMSEDIQGITKEYSAVCAENDANCLINLEIENDITGPVYVYYQLDNFYQNHRRYVKSRSNAQLMGEEFTDTADVEECDPIIKNKDVAETGLMSYDGTVDLSATAPDAIAFPCGLVAKSVFTDKFSEFKAADGTEYTINSDNIAWESDIEYKFKNLDREDWKQVQWMDVEDGKYKVLLVFVVLEILTAIFRTYRTLHCLDENCWSAKLPQALGKDREGPAKG